MLVSHATLGVGKVVAVEPTAVHIFFADANKQDATKLRLPAARVFLDAPPSARDERLENLPAFSLDPVSGRYAPSPKPRAASRRKVKR
jgi:hypothetical protein